MVDFLDIESLARRIPDGAHVAIAPEYSGVSMAATRALVQRGARGLRVVTVPTSGLQADILIGAGCVAEIETAGVTLGEYGLAPRFTAAAKAGNIRILDATCPAIHAGLQAAEKGIPFMPLRGLIGSDLLKVRPEWRIGLNPFEQSSDSIVLLPSIHPDVALFHAARADKNGNVWIGRRRELATMAHAARTAIVTVEEIVDTDLMAKEETAAGTLPALYVGAVSSAPCGAWPLGFLDLYGPDDAELSRYAAAARTEEGFRTYLEGALRPAA